MSNFTLKSGVYLITNVPFGSILSCNNITGTVQGWAGFIYNNITLSAWTLTQITATGLWTIQQIYTGYYLSPISGADDFAPGSVTVCAQNTTSTSWGITTTSDSSGLRGNIFSPKDSSLNLALSLNSPVPGIPVFINNSDDQSWTFQQLS